MLKNTHKYTQTHHVLISIFTSLLILSVIILPILSTPLAKSNAIKTPSQFMNLINNDFSIVRSSSSLSSLTVSKVIMSSLSSIAISSIETHKPEIKLIEEVKPVFVQPITTVPVQNIEPQTEIQEIIIPQPKPTIKETPKPIVKNITEPKPTPIVAPTPIIQTPKIVVDNSFTSTGCDQSLAIAMFNEVNDHRVANGVKKILLSEQLSNIGCAHSKWMTTTGIFSHTGRDGTSPFERCKKAGTYCYAENVAYNTIPNVQDLFNQFKNSPGHNENMLDPNFVEIGIAFDGIYVTQVFR